MPATGLPSVAYPNRGGTWDAAVKRWAYGDPVDLALVDAWVDAWVDAGARFVGDCCCNGPVEIAALARHLSRG